MNKEKFINWLIEKGHSPSLKSNYPLYLEKYIPEILTQENIQIKNLFEVNDSKQVNELLTLFLNNKKLIQINKDKNSFPTASLKKYLEYLGSYDDKEVMYNQQNQINIKNIILYGAPGVGKTHNYKKIVALIEGQDFKEQEIFDFIVNNKDDEIEEGSVERLFKNITLEKRLEFVTFHQSYSYEDFIEGFRPNESGNIELEDGIFKIISDKAKLNLENSQKQLETIKEEKKFNELFGLFQDLIQDEIDVNKKFDINETAYITNVENDAFRYQGDNWGNTQRMKFSDIELLYNLNISERKEIKHLENISGLAKQHATYFSYLMKKFLNFNHKQKLEIIDVERINEKNFYIVIDEINRGNISKIFGELITLIEEDKRDIYKVTLPYSKKKFSVPSNLYIIATMNSTDKSIATIDIALRRRFTFLKMKPNETLVPEIAKKLFSELNNFIKEKLGEDYMLGHSYFMKIENDEDLEFVKEYKIKPLLEEYFYADEENYKKAVEILNSKVKEEIDE